MARKRGRKNVERRKGSQQKLFCVLHFAFCLQLNFGFGFAQAGDAVAVLPLAAFLEQLRAFKTLEHIPFAA
jgi:hypothetical protein